MSVKYAINTTTVDVMVVVVMVDTLTETAEPMTEMVMTWAVQWDRLLLLEVMIGTDEVEKLAIEQPNDLAKPALIPTEAEED